MIFSILSTTSIFQLYKLSKTTTHIPCLKVPHTYGNQCSRFRLLLKFSKLFPPFHLTKIRFEPHFLCADTTLCFLYHSGSKSFVFLCYCTSYITNFNYIEVCAKPCFFCIDSSGFLNRFHTTKFSFTRLIVEPPKPPPVMRALAGYWVDEMTSNGFEMVAVAQGPFTWSQPMREMGAAFADKKVNYNKNPVLLWCLTNTAVKKAGSIISQPVKISDKRRIDGAVSLLNAWVIYVRDFEDYMYLVG